VATTADSSPPIERAAHLADVVLRPGLDAQRSWFGKSAAADIAGVGAASALTTGILAWQGLPLVPAVWAFSLILLVPLIAAARGTYLWRMHLEVIDSVSASFLEVGLAWLVVTSAWALLSPDLFRPRTLLLACVAAALTVSTARAALYSTETASRRRGRSLRPTLIVGAGRIGSLVARRLVEHPEFGLLPLGHLDDDPLELAGERRLLPVIGGTTALESTVKLYGIEQVVITFSRTPHEELLSVAERAGALGLDVALIPRLYEKTSRRVAVGRVGGLPLLDLRVVDPDSFHYLRVKNVLDRFLAAFFLLILSPLFAAVSAAIWITMRRPIFFRQIRVGANEAHFVMLKFRTMASGATGEVAFQLPPDTAPGGVEGKSDRRTALGRFLRSSSIDELPQLLNVLKGEMSLIGPRPERPQFVREFNSSVDGYTRRHRIKGGITGWSQVHGLRGQTSISERAEWDNYYVENVSLLLDVKILLLTIAALLRGLLPSSSHPT